MSGPIALLDHPICLTEPERRAPSHWLEHTPFAMWLTSVLRPRVLVELGTFYGTSYCAFCQAIAALGLPTRAFAVDTWEGDPHNGPNTHEVLDDLRRHHDARYSRFSTLLQMPFDAAQSHFADGEIDLLHIDGYHTYEAVRHDFETWRSKVSDRGVVLFHDVAEHIADFGVWKFWDELTSEHRGFAFRHEHGLGVLALGPDVPDEVRRLVELEGREVETVRSAFHAIGRRLRLEDDLVIGRAERDAACGALDSARAEAESARAEAESARALRDAATAERDIARVEADAALALRDATVADRDRLLAALRENERQLAGLRREWDELHASQSFRAFRQAFRVAGRLGPEGSRRRRAMKRLARLVEVVAHEGPIGFARRQARQVIERDAARRGPGDTGNSPVADGPAAHRPKPPVGMPGETPHSKGNSHARLH